MPVIPILSDNGNCLTFKAVGTVDSIEFSHAHDKFTSDPIKSKQITYVLIDYSETLEVTRSEENFEHLRSSRETNSRNFSDIIIAVLSDKLMQHSHEDIWRQYALELGWKYAVFTNRERLNEWVFANVSDRYDGFITRSSLVENRIAINHQGLEKFGFVLDPLANYLNISTALIMSYHDNSLVVLESNSLSEINPYQPGTKIVFGKGNNYFEHTIESGKEVYIANAKTSEQWQGSAPLNHGFISFIGLPIYHPTGDIFGLICLLNESPILLHGKQRETLLGTRDILEAQLKLKFDNEKIHEHLREILDLQLSLENESRSDYLTGFYNRKNFLEISKNELSRSRRNGTALSYIFCDIDHFKNINDIYGHNAGDEVLRQLSTLIKDNIRAYDTVWRWGGEEFLIQLPETDVKMAGEVASKLRSVIDEASISTRQHNLHITVSFGVSEINPDELIDDFLARLDKLLYEAKNRGRNQVITAPKENKPLL